MLETLKKTVTAAMLAGAVAVVVVAGAASPAAAEVTLRAISFAPEQAPFSREFVAFIERVNETGKGKVQIRFVGGGPKVMPAFEIGSAIRNRVFDIATSPGAFYTNLVPEANAIKLSQFTPAEERANGARDYMNKLHNEKMNAEYVASLFACDNFYLYLNERIDEPDLTGLRLRASKGAGQPLFQAMGATTMQMPPASVFTALERSTIDGYGWPLLGLQAFGLHQVTKFRVEPGFYKTTIVVLANLEAWNELDAEQQKVITDAAVWIEERCPTERTEQARAAQAEAGIEAITFSEAETAEFLDLARQTAWDDVIADSPEHGAELKALYSRE